MGFCEGYPPLIDHRATEAPFEASRHITDRIIILCSFVIWVTHICVLWIPLVLFLWMKQGFIHCSHKLGTYNYVKYETIALCTIVHIYALCTIVHIFLCYCTRIVQLVSVTIALLMKCGCNVYCTYICACNILCQCVGIYINRWK